MSFYAIHSEHRETVCGLDEDGYYYLFIINTERNTYTYNSNGSSTLTIDNLLDLLTQHNIPVPRDFRTQLVTDQIVGIESHIHYYFDSQGKEIGRHDSEV